MEGGRDEGGVACDVIIMYYYCYHTKRGRERERLIHTITHCVRVVS